MTRAATVTALAALASGVATPALAAPVDAGAEPGQPLTLVETLLLFVGAPLGLFVLISLFVVAPSVIRGGRQTSPGDAEPLWFGGPNRTEREEEPTTEAAGQPSAGGGASARW